MVAAYVETPATREDIGSVVLALFNFKQDYGYFPKDLDDLTAGYMQSIPYDRFSGNDLGYQKYGDYFLLYSVGNDETDSFQSSRNCLDLFQYDIGVFSDPHVWVNQR